MKKHLLTLLLLIVIGHFAWSQPNCMIANTATTFTLNQPCGLVLDGDYIVDVNYFDPGGVGDWVPGPDDQIYRTYSNVHVTRNLTTQDVLYDFSDATPAAPNFPVDMYTIQGWMKVVSANVKMHWDNKQLTCHPLPVTLISFSAQKSGCNVNLTFVTADEYDMTQFVIERNSTAGSGILNMPVCYKTPINDHMGHTYTFTDSYPLNGSNFYRLKMTGLSGYVKYSQVIAVNASGCTAVHPAVNCGTIPIVGPASICGHNGHADYTLTNNPSYTVNAWSWYINDQGATMSTDYGPTTIVGRPNWDPNGSVELRSLRTGCTVGTQYSYKLIQLGTGVMNGYYYPNNDLSSHTLYRETWGDNVLGHGNNNLVRVENPTGTQTWEMTQSYSDGTPVTWSYDGMYLHINMPSSGYGWGEFRMTIPTACGTAEYYFEFWTDDSYRLTPNPATSEILIASVGKSKSGQSVAGKLRNKSLVSNTIRQVIIVDRAGRLVMQKVYGADTKQVNINTSSLKPDFYIARIYDGKTWKVMKFIKK